MFVVTPIVAIAIENQIYYFKDFSPYMRFDLPAVQFSSEEKKLWQDLKGVKDQQQFINVTEKFFQLRESGVAVSALTSELIAFEDIGP